MPIQLANNEQPNLPFIRVLLFWHAARDVAHRELIEPDWIPFFEQQAKPQQATGGFELYYAKEEEFEPGPDDYFVCYEPTEKDREQIVRLAGRFSKGKRILISCRENPVAHHYRRWRFKTTFLENFDLVFSSMGLFADQQKFYWVPFWNFLKYPSQAIEMQANYNPRSNFLAINPLRSGAPVNPDRNKIISDFCGSGPDIHIFGQQDLFDKPPFLTWKANWQSEIPYGEEPFTFAPKISIFEKYNFCLVSENTFVDGYITEKLAEPLAALAIPVYFGPKNIELYLPELFKQGAINGHGFQDTSSLIKYLRAMPESEIKNRAEHILQVRDSYLELTARHRIWAFMFEKIFNLPASENSLLIASANSRLNELNHLSERQAQRTRVTEIIKGPLLAQEYEAKVRQELLS